MENIWEYIYIYISRMHTRPPKKSLLLVHIISYLMDPCALICTLCFYMLCTYIYIYISYVCVHMREKHFYVYIYIYLHISMLVNMYIWVHRYVLYVNNKYRKQWSNGYDVLSSKDSDLVWHMEKANVWRWLRIQLAFSKQPLKPGNLMTWRYQSPWCGQKQCHKPPMTGKGNLSVCLCWFYPHWSIFDLFIYPWIYLLTCVGLPFSQYNHPTMTGGPWKKYLPIGMVGTWVSHIPWIASDATTSHPTMTGGWKINIIPLLWFH